MAAVPLTWGGRHERVSWAGGQGGLSAAPVVGGGGGGNAGRSPTCGGCSWVAQQHSLLCSVELKESCGWRRRDLTALGLDHGFCHTWRKYTDD